MFFEGSLQEGIAASIQQQKLVACFVRSDDDEFSKTWEDEWFNLKPEGSDHTLGESLAQKAVVLRLQSGTQEAEFLSAFCALKVTPKLVVIQNGSVVEDLEGGISEADFIRRLAAALGLNASTAKQTENMTATQDNSSEVQAMLAERRTRLEKDQKAKEEAEQAAQQARSKARREEKKPATGPSASARTDWAQQRKIDLQQEKLAKERVMRSIEADKAARREKEEQRRLLSKIESGEISEEAAAATVKAAEASSPTTSPLQSGGSCALQIRLFDGSSLRSKFAADATLSSSVRTYVNENTNSDLPYNFRLMLTPHPSRNIDISEENESLQALGLCPSATLVLVPVKGYTEAYAAGGASGVLSQGFNMGYNVVTGAFGLVGGLLGKVTGYGGEGGGPYVAGTGDEVEPSNVQGTKMAQEPQPSGQGIKIRTLADQRREEKGNEFYNGNQLNFEPRKDEDEE